MGMKWQHGSTNMAHGPAVAGAMPSQGSQPDAQLVLSHGKCSVKYQTAVARELKNMYVHVFTAHAAVIVLNPLLLGAMGWWSMTGLRGLRVLLRLVGEPPGLSAQLHGRSPHRLVSG